MIHEKINVTPVYMEIKEKSITPESIYETVKGKDTYLLESSEGCDKVARYSFIGFNPAAKLSVKNSKINFKIFDHDIKRLEIKSKKNPLYAMRELMRQFKLNKAQPIARFFGGFVGYFSYDLVRYFVDLDSNMKDDLKEPDCEFVLTKNNVIFDHKLERSYLLSNEFLKPADVDARNVITNLKEISKEIELERYEKTEFLNRDVRDVSSNISKEEFEKSVKIAKDYIYKGDIFQVVLSQRFETEFDADKFFVYKNLKQINPSPYMYYLDFGDRKLIGSSPEMLVRVEKKVITTYPIAGTRPRGKTPSENKKLENEMLNDEKECAEHVMLVDLGRNDIGKVAEFGSIKVNKFMKVEKYSHVQHIISEVVGKLRSGKDEFDVFRSIFPAGTVSGAPKIRAMEIIDELETTRRGIYAGAVGYFSFNGVMDTAITIRTILFEKNRAYVQVGAGIVADSKPENEYEETMNKGQALMKALGVEEK